MLNILVIPTIMQKTLYLDKSLNFARISFWLESLKIVFLSNISVGLTFSLYFCVIRGIFADINDKVS